MSGKREDRKWNELTWFKKVQICEQGISNEDSLLSTYVTIYIAIQAMFFVIALSLDYWWWFPVVIAFLAFFVSVLFIRLFLIRGDAVDRWSEILAGLWTQEVSSTLSDKEKGVSELAQYYEGAVERRKKSKWSRFWGWNWWGTYKYSEGKTSKKFRWVSRILHRRGRFGFLNSARWILVTLMPVMVSMGWITIIIITVINELDC